MASTSQSSRLYVGNLASSVDEYALIQLCSKYGKIAKLDYLFHKIGPMKGKPRGFAFVMFSTHQEALRAIEALHDKLFRGRKLIVTTASEQTYDPNDPRSGSSSGGRGRGRGQESRPTAISLLKGQGVAGASTDRKIAALEAKLSALKKAKEADSGASTSQGGAKGSGEEGEWLDALLPSVAEGSGTPDSTSGGGGKGETTTSPRKTVVDPKAAGLPPRPYFDAVASPRTD